MDEAGGWRTVDTAVVNGDGILLDNHVARHHADMEAIFTFEGTDSVQALIVGREITGLRALQTDLTDRNRPGPRPVDAVHDQWFTLVVSESQQAEPLLLAGYEDLRAHPPPPEEAAIRTALAEVPDPVLTPKGVLIQVEAISIEGGDTLNRAGGVMAILGELDRAGPWRFVRTEAAGRQEDLLHQRKRRHRVRFLHRGADGQSGPSCAGCPGPGRL